MRKIAYIFLLMAIIAFNISCSRNKMQNRYEPDLLNEAVDSIFRSVSMFNQILNMYEISFIAFIPFSYWGM